MSVLLEGDERLERELTGEPVALHATGSIVLHVGLAGVIILYGIIGGFFHSNIWGGAAAGGAIRVNLVSSALPLPSDQPPNQNVLATEKPSQAPALPTPKAAPTVDEKAIPILGKPKEEKPKPLPAPKTPPKVPPKPDNRAQYGEQAASSMPRAVQGQTTTTGPTSVSEGDFGSKFPWYVDNINRKMSQSWNKFEVDPHTPKGARVFLVFTIHRDGTPADVLVDRSSGSSTLDRSCMRGAQRVDTFGNLPAGYNSSSLKVSYYCEY
jgi:periplasmic protein TonB